MVETERNLISPSVIWAKSQTIISTAILHLHSYKQTNKITGTVCQQTTIYMLLCVYVQNLSVSMQEEEQGKIQQKVEQTGTRRY